MGFYLTFGVSGRENTNLVPFTLSAQGTLSGGPTIGVLTATLQELPTAFPGWDLSLWLVPGAHVKAWQEEGGRIVFRYFGGILLDAQEVCGPAEAPTARQWVATAQGYDGAALDACAAGQLSGGRAAFTIPAGTFAAQVRFAAAWYNRGAALQMDWTSQVAPLTGAHVYAALPVKSSTFRQVLRTLCARAVAVNHDLQPRFRVDVREGAASDFGPPVLYVADAAVANPPDLTFVDGAPLPGEWQTLGPLARTVTIRPPFADRALVSNIGGAYAEAQAPSAGVIPNLLSRAGTYDTVAVNVANADAELPGEAGRLAARTGRPREELRLASFGRARPGRWVKLRSARLHGGYATGKAVVVTDGQFSYTTKTQPATINGQRIGNPVVLAYTATDRPPELGDDPDNGPDLSQVLASTPSTDTRNLLRSSNEEAKHPLVTTPIAAAGGAEVSAPGWAYPYVWMPHWRSDGLRKLVATQPVYFAVANIGQHPATPVPSYTLNGVAGSPPFTLAAGDILIADVAGVDPSDPLVVTHVGTRPL